MNKAIAISLILLASIPLAAGWAQEAENNRIRLAPFYPGLAWKVEALPDTLRSLGLEGSSRPTAQSSQEKSRLIEEDAVLSDGYRKQVLFEERGEKIVRYIRGNLYIVARGGGEFSIEYPDPELAESTASSKSLQEFHWVAPRWKAGSAVVDGAECDIYARPWPLKSAGDEATQGSRVFAAIGREDRLPRRLETPLSIRKYTFSTQTHPEQLPDGVILAIHRMNEAAKEVVQRYAVPQ